jgi:hypothetical protein
MSLLSWALRNGVGPAALNELQIELGLLTPTFAPEDPGQGKSEGWVQSMARLEASRRGIRAFRNNVGALPNPAGRPVRFGLANESKEINEDVVKSSDLVGWRKLVIDPRMVGYTVAQFWCREIKEPGWQFTGQGREGPQKAWIDMVNAEGGDAAFLTDPGQV